MAKGFGKQTKRSSSVSKAAELLLDVARQAGKPLVIPMFPPGNELGLKPGEVKPGHTEIRPSCDGIVAAVACSADEAQEVLDLLMNWRKSKLNKGVDRNDA